MASKSISLQRGGFGSCIRQTKEIPRGVVDYNADQIIC